MATVEHLPCHGCDRIICYCPDRDCPGTTEPGCTHGYTFCIACGWAHCPDCRDEVRADSWWTQ